MYGNRQLTKKPDRGRDTERARFDDPRIFSGFQRLFVLIVICRGDNARITGKNLRDHSPAT